MKKLGFCLFLTLSLVGCTQPGTSGPVPGGQSASAEMAEAESTQAAAADGDRTPTAAELGREETAELTFILEGQEETVPAALYIGQGYSLYLPTEGWEWGHFTENGVLSDFWESTDNSDVELRIFHLGERSIEECREGFVQELSDYVVTEDKQGGLYVEDTEESMVMDVRFHEGGGNVYAVTWTYPMETAEGFGIRLNVLADTFEVMA